MERFFSQLDRQLSGRPAEGGGSDGGNAASGGALARSGSGSGSGGGGGEEASIRLPRDAVRLPPLPPGRRFGEEYEARAGCRVAGMSC